MKLLIIGIFSLFSFLGLTQDVPKELAGFDPKTDIIADNYEAGAYLIYDCEEAHWTCVTKPYFEECIKEHKQDYSCSPFEEFPTKKSCFQRQLYLTTHHVSHSFCSKEKVKNFLE